MMKAVAVPAISSGNLYTEFCNEYNGKNYKYREGTINKTYMTFNTSWHKLIQSVNDPYDRNLVLQIQKKKQQ